MQLEAEMSCLTRHRGLGDIVTRTVLRMTERWLFKEVLGCPQHLSTIIIVVALVNITQQQCYYVCLS